MMLHTLSLTHYHKRHIVLENDSVNKQHSRHDAGKFFTGMVVPTSSFTI
jgi:hypothetical protein